MRGSTPTATAVSGTATAVPTRNNDAAVKATLARIAAGGALRPTLGRPEGIFDYCPDQTRPPVPDAASPRLASFRWRPTRPASDDDGPRPHPSRFAAGGLCPRLPGGHRAPDHVRPDAAGRRPALSTRRPDTLPPAGPIIIDRNGQILATDIRTASVYAEPRKIFDPDEASEALVSVFPDLNQASLRAKLATGAAFAWIKREITPDQAKAVQNLGIPGVAFTNENKRFYPGGATAAHIVGLVNVDNQGIAGIEKYIDDHGLADLHAVRLRLGRYAAAGAAVDRPSRPARSCATSWSTRCSAIRPIAATGVVLNVHTGEVMAMVSLPDYDPNDPVDAQKPDRLNRMSAGVYELGSVFKSFTFAMALDTGTWTLSRHGRRRHAHPRRRLHHQ